MGVRSHPVQHKVAMPLQTPRFFPATEHRIHAPALAVFGLPRGAAPPDTSAKSLMSRSGSSQVSSPQAAQHATRFNRAQPPESGTAGQVVGKAANGAQCRVIVQAVPQRGKAVRPKA